MNTYFLDVTQTLSEGFHTGIQRTVRELTTRCVKLGHKYGVAVTPVMAARGQFYPLIDASEAALQSGGPLAGRSVHREQGIWIRAARKIAAYMPPKLYAGMGDWKADRAVAPSVAALCHPTPVAIAQGDVVALIDSLHGLSPAVSAARNARKCGACVIVLVYDLIALTHPEYVSRNWYANFKRSLDKVVPSAAGIVTISRFVTGEVQTLLKTMGVRKPVRHFYLGHDLVRDGSEVVSDRVLPDTIWADQEPVFLMVGSVVERKGHSLVLDAFEDLWARGGKGKLLIIGKTIGDMSGFVDRCVGHPEASKRLFLAHGVGDAELAEVIARADAGIIAATVEGFGLPLIEFLGAGLPVLASDIPVFREIAGDHAIFFDVADPKGLAAQLARFPTDRDEHRARVAGFEWIDWQDSAHQFMRAMADVLAEARCGPGGGE